MKGKTLLWTALYVGVGYGIYYMYFSKNAYAKKIINARMYARSESELKSFDMGFLRQWSIAASKNDPNFSYKGKIYNTKGGSAVR